MCFSSSAKAHSCRRRPRLQSLQQSSGRYVCDVASPLADVLFPLCFLLYAGMCFFTACAERNLVCVPATQGVKPVPMAAAVGLGLLLRFAVPIPAEISLQAWTLLSIFVSAIVGEAHCQRRSGLILI